MESYSTAAATQDLFDDIPVLIHASQGKRFLNYVIDRIIAYILFYALAYILSFLNMRIVVNLNPDTASFMIVSLLIYSFYYASLMGFTEFILKGKTVGKFFTGTRAVTESGHTLALKDALQRGICRIIPFNAFSALGNSCHPWHDTFSNTCVIDEKQSTFRMDQTL